MKSFKKHIRESYNDMSRDVKGRVPLEDLHRFSSDSKVLSKLNTWIGDIADREHITVEAAMQQLYRKVTQIGIQFEPSITEDEVGDNGSKDIPISQYGGRMGKDLEGNDINDNFIDAKGSDLKLHVEWERQPNMMFKVVASVK
tara:strand:+ start:971 stop:1399 length:429 start_codon:yes stop_codon:yes gene_type:complete